MAARVAAIRCFQSGVKKTAKSLYSSGFFHEPHGRVLRAEFAPIYVALGLIGLSASLGLYTATHELEYAPNVLLRKKRRETMPEVEDPDWATSEAGLFIDHSFFRRLAHLQDYPHPSSARTETVVDLKSVAVDPGRH